MSILPFLACNLPSSLTITSISEIEIIQEGSVKIDLIDSFKNAGLHPVMEKNIELCGYEAPTPIQKCILPSIFLGHDTIGIAQTGKLSPSEEREAKATPWDDTC